MDGQCRQMRNTLPNILSWRSVQVHLNINCEAEKEKDNTKESQSTKKNDLLLKKKMMLHRYSLLVIDYR